jgi:putative hydrolase of HD superfamily
MIRKALLLKLFQAAYMQRWNDKLRPVDLYELDKQGHKMIIAYFVGKFEENKKGFNWVEIIEGGIFELLQRIVLTDLKPPILYRIKEDAEKYQELNNWVCTELESYIQPFNNDFWQRFKNYLSDTEDGLNRRVLAAAHFYATGWEFSILERANPRGYEMDEIRKNLDTQQEKYYDLPGIQQLALRSKYRQFIDLCGELRFQIRWSHIHRAPKTSVMGHQLFVAIISYLLSLHLGACPRRLINNYFTGLFHDLPEVMTKDISSPVKGAVPGLGGLIAKIEKDLMEREVYALLPKKWRSQVRFFTEKEFTDVVTIDGKRQEVTSQQIVDSYNDDCYEPRDGTLVKAADDLAAFIEACAGIDNGSASPELADAKMQKRGDYKGMKIGNLDLSAIYADFD